MAQQLVGGQLLSWKSECGFFSPLTDNEMTLIWREAHLAFFPHEGKAWVGYGLGKSPLSSVSCVDTEGPWQGVPIAAPQSEIVREKELGVSHHVGKLLPPEVKAEEKKEKRQPRPESPRIKWLAELEADHKREFPPKYAVKDVKFGKPKEVPAAEQVVEIVSFAKEPKARKAPKLRVVAKAEPKPRIKRASNPKQLELPGC